jgi:hypothetical protein
MTRRIFRSNKAGHIDHQQQPLSQLLGLSDEQWLTLTTEFEKHFCYTAGGEMMMNQFEEQTGYQRLRGMGKAKTLLRCT